MPARRPSMRCFESAMKKIIRKLSEAFLGLVLLSLLAAVLIPWRNEPSRSTPTATSIAAAARLRSDPAPVRPSPELASPDSVLALFVKRVQRMTPTNAPVIVETKPMDAPWLVFLGFYSSTGEPRYVLKDTRSGRVITIGARNASAGGWALVAIEEKHMIVRKDSETFVVQKR
jgi:hypothetical protein